MGGVVGGRVFWVDWLSQIFLYLRSNTTKEVFMSQKTSWINDALQVVKDKNGNLTEEDEKNLREAMRIPNDDVSINDVSFKRHRSYL